MALADAPTDIRISGITFYRNGHPWLAKGFTTVAFVAPKAHRNSIFSEANRRYGKDELKLARDVYHIDTIRIQVSQPGLDPQSSIFDPSYADEITAAVRLAEEAGFVVIISMQWESSCGLPNVPGHPTDSTARAWKTIGPGFAKDHRVLFELLNEPSTLESEPNAFEAWGTQFQELVNAVRSFGSENVLILDGLHYASFVGANLPQVMDPLHQWAYGVHPYFYPGNSTPADWDRLFGNTSHEHAMLVSEWASASDAGGGCLADTPTTSATLLKYVRHHGLGITAWALDYPDTTVGDVQTLAPTTYAKFIGCGKGTHSGAGELFRDWH
jgi:hypothetical protein